MLLGPMLTCVIKIKLEYTVVKHLTNMIVMGGMVFLMWGTTSIMFPFAAATPPANGLGKPIFQTVTAKNVRIATHIVSSRSTAVFGFNTPVVRIYLPRIDNSAYAIIKFDEPKLLNNNGKSVTCEIERGGYDIYIYSDEIRFASPDRKKTVTYAKAIGTGQINYPLKITTSIIHPVEGVPDSAVATINGNFVTYTDQNIPEMVFHQSQLGPVRAYDATGRQLIMGDYNASQAQGEIMRRTLSFLGKIAKVEVDTVTEWADLAFTYDLPPTKPLPESYSGHSVSRPPKITATPGGKVSVMLIQDKEPVAKKAAAAKSSQKLDTGLDFFHHALAMPTNPENESAIKQLIKAGADVNAKDNWGRMSLHFVTYRCDTTIVVQALIEAGADVNARTANGHTPLWFAQQMKCQENIRLLKQAGAK